MCMVYSKGKLGEIWQIRRNLANLGINFLPRNFCTTIFLKVSIITVIDLFATPKGKPVAAAGSCGHRKTTAKNWENISHHVRGQTRGF